MRVLVLGGTGLIGAAIVRELVAAGHDVLGLARSDAAAARLEDMGAWPLRGDMRRPQGWTRSLPQVDGVIHAAADFADDMGKVEGRLLDALLPTLATMPGRPRVVYTGGCWLYAATGPVAATEDTPFDPLPAFAWMVPHMRRVLAAPGVAGMAVHPAMVHTDDGGFLDAFIQGARERNRVRVVEREDVHWPIVHADDLAVLYRLVLEHGVPGGMYNGAAVEDITVGALARAVAARYGSPACMVEVVTADAVAAAEGEWMRGYALDQRMSGDKARRELGWRPVHAAPLDDVSETAQES